MLKKINWWKFLLGSIVLFAFFIIVADIAMDKLLHPKEFDWNKIFGFENLFWKVLSSLVGAYFYASNSPEEKNNAS